MKDRGCSTLDVSTYNSPVVVAEATAAAYKLLLDAHLRDIPDFLWPFCPLLAPSPFPPLPPLILLLSLF